MQLPDPTGQFRLDARVVVVTGASSGLGARFATTLAGAGARLVLAARRLERIEALAAEIADAGGEAVAIACDVTDDSSVEALIAGATERFGRLDVLVNNAGVAVEEDAAIETLRSFREVVAVNLTGAYACAREAGRVMLANGAGAIVNTASISGLVAGDGEDTPSYTASKGAIINLTRELAVRWADRGIRVNAIAPGWFPTEMTTSYLRDPGGKRVREPPDAARQARQDR